MSLFAVRDGKLKYINKTNCPNIIVMANWASKANYNNPLFTVYHTLQFAKHKGIYGGRRGGGINLPITTVMPGQCVRRHRNARTLSVCLSYTTEPNWPFYVFLSPRVILGSSACTFCLTGMFCRRVKKTYRKIHSVHDLSLFSSNIVTQLSSSIDVCIGVRECARALCCVVFYYPRFR